MKLERSLASITTERTSVALLLQLIVVSIRVQSSCVEEDCADPAIKVISRSSGECVTCFPCSPCSEGQRLSVPCPSTVLEGTDINCVPMVQADPLSVSISSASAYATGVFFTLLASPSLTSLKSSPSRTRPIIETDISHIHNQRSVSATSSTGSHPSITVAVVETKESDDSGIGQHSYVKVATLSGCSVALMFIIVVAIVYIFKKRGPTTNCFPCNNNVETRPNLTSGSGDSESCSVLLSPEDDTALYVNQKLQDAQQDSTCQENDSQPLQHIGQTLSDDGTIPLSLDDCSLGEDCRQIATSEGATGVNVAGSLQDPTSEVSPEKPSLLSTDLKPIAVPPITCFTPKCIINVIQTPRAACQQWNGSVSEVEKQRLIKWADLSQTEKYSSKMNQVPFCLLHNICLTLDIIREADGKDVREFASKLNISVPEFERLQQAAKVESRTTTSVILARIPSWTVADFVSIMKDMEREDIIDLISGWK